MSVNLLCISSGSSSLQFALYQLGAAVETSLADGMIERIGLPGSHLRIRTAATTTALDEPGDVPDSATAVYAAFAALDTLRLPSPDAVGHRVVHGGADHVTPECVDAQLIEVLRRLVAYVPLHLPAAIQGIEAVAARVPYLPQVACFDTAFHRRMPELAQRFPLPRSFWEEGIRRYGFHGLSYEDSIAHLGAMSLGRASIAHLGNSASMAAVYNRQPLEITMGFTPTGGLMMGTRTGDLDPRLLHLLTEKGYDTPQLTQLVQ